MGYGTNMSIASAGVQADAGNSYNESGKIAEVAIQFGSPVVKSSVASKVKLPVQDVTDIIFDADFVASNNINLKVNGVAISEVTYATSHANTATLLVAAITALTGVSCSKDSTGRIFTVTMDAGVTCLVSDVAVTAGASQAGSTLLTKSTDLFKGIAVQINNGTGEYSVGEAVTWKRQGRIHALVSSTSIVEDDAVYIDLATPSKFTNVSSGNLAIDGVFRSEDVSGIAIVEINLP